MERDITSGYLCTKRNEYKLSEEFKKLHIRFPGIKETSMALLLNKSLKIDHVEVEYNPQVPFNATGTVTLEVHDRRLLDEDSLQAEYTWPIACPCSVHFYSTSFFSTKDPIPWELLYKVTNSNVLSGTHFAKMKGKLKLSAVSKGTTIPHRPPNIVINSPLFTMEMVDFRHTKIPLPNRAFCRSASQSYERQPVVPMLPGESWARHSAVGECADVFPSAVDGAGDDVSDVDRRDRKLMTGVPTFADPGPSVSQVGSDSVSMTPEALAGLIDNVIKNNRQDGGKLPKLEAGTIRPV